jgi:hypothetical protein
VKAQACVVVYPRHRAVAFADAIAAAGRAAASLEEDDEVAVCGEGELDREPGVLNPAREALNLEDVAGGRVITRTCRGHRTVDDSRSLGSVANTSIGP